MSTLPAFCSRLVGVVLLFFSTAQVTGHAQGVELLSARGPGLPPAAGGNGDSSAPVLSADGRFVVFASTANNLLPASNQMLLRPLIPATLNVFLRDRSSGTNALVSINRWGSAGGNADSLPLDVSTNGQFVLFESSASDLVADDTNNVNDIFVRDVVTGTTLLVSVGTNGTAANGVSRSAVMTPDGRYVAFASEAGNLVAGDTNRISDVFVRDLQENTTTLVSVNAVSRDYRPDVCELPLITPDGRYVAFYSTATNLVPGVRSGGDIYVRDLFSGTTAWASRYARTAVLAQTVLCFNHALSADGRFVAYEASGNALNSPTPSTRGIVLRYDTTTTLTDMVGSNAAARPTLPTDIRTLDMTPDGQYIAFLSNTNGTNGATTCVRLWDASTKTSRLVSGNMYGRVPDTSTCHWPTLDASGRFVAFVSGPSNLTANPMGGEYHIYLRDTQAGTTSVVDTVLNGAAGLLSASTLPRLSADGRFLAFESPDGSLTPNDSNHAYDVFLRDLFSGAIELVSACDPSVTSITPSGPNVCGPASLSDDARYVVFASEADDLMPGDTNGVRDVFCRDLVSGTTVLVSAATNGACGDGASSGPTVTGDGRYVAFTSLADNLAPGDTNRVQDVFLRDLQSGSTRLLSVERTGANSGSASSYGVSVDGSGQHALFLSQAGNLTFDVVSGPENVFLRDLQAGSTYALTTDGGSVGSMTPDGRFVAFIGKRFANTASNLYVWDTVTGSLVFTNTAPSISTCAISPHGDRLALWSWYAVNGANLFAVERQSGDSTLIASALKTGPHPVLHFSADDRWLVFTQPVNNTNQVYLFDCEQRTLSIVSHAFNAPSTAAAGVSDSPVLSSDGRFVVFRSDAADLVAGLSSFTPQLFLYDRLTGTNTMLTAGLVGLTPNNRSLAPVFSRDGRTLLFQSWASDLVPNDLNQSADLFAYSFLFGVILPASTLSEGPWLSWPWAVGKNYRVEYKETMDEPSWHELSGSITNNGKRAYVQDTSPAGPQRFYRILAF